MVELRQRVAALDGLGPKEPGTEPPGAANGHGAAATSGLRRRATLLAVPVVGSIFLL